MRVRRPLSKSLVRQGGVLAAASVCLLLACIASLGLGATPARAALFAQFGSEGEGAGQFASPSGIAIDQGSGDVYVADTSNNRVDKFGPHGEFLLAWGWGVATGAAEAQTCGPEAAPPTTTCRAGLEGAGAGQFASFSVDGVAVDGSLGVSHGDVYVEDGRNERVEKFTPNGEFVLTFGGEVNKATKGDVCLAGEECQAGVEVEEGKPVPGAFERLSPRALAVGPTGGVYVGDIERVQRFSEGGVYAATTPLPGDFYIEGVAVDAAEDIYVNSEPATGVRKYDSAGTELGAPRAPSASGFYAAMALGPSGELFVANSSANEGHVFEYTSAGAQVSNFAVEGAGEESVGGLAYGENAKALYVLYGASVRATGLPAPGPQVRAGGESVSEILPTDAKLNARLDPEGAETTVHFEYGETEAYGTSTSPQVLSGGSFEDQTASAPLSGLKPRTTYHFRVLASSECEPIEHPGRICTAEGEDETFTTLPPVSIEAESVSQVSSAAATLEAELNGHSRLTAYRFEYGRTSKYEASIPVPDGSAGAGGGVVSVSALVEGLAPDTVYHYRVVASNAAGASEGQDETFTTQDAATEVSQPDGRAWEMVSPPQKEGVRLEAFGIGLGTEGGLVQAAEDGHGLTYIAKAPIEANPAGNRTFSYQQLLATRTPGGWATKDISTPNESVAGVNVLSEYSFFSPDLSRALVEPEGDTPLSSATSEWSPYVREPGGEYLPLITGCPAVGEPCKSSVAEHADVPPGTKFGPQGAYGGGQSSTGGVKFVMATADFSHVLLTSTQSLVAGFATGGSTAIYEWRQGAPLQPVSLLPGEESAASEGGAEVGLFESGATPAVRHAFSADGRRVFFSTTHNGSERHLYMRDVEKGKTVQLDTPEAGAQGGGGEADFQDASSDGSKVFFTDTARLTIDATSQNGFPQTADLYMCEIGEAAGRPTCRLKDLTVDRNAGESANVQGTLVGAGEDGREVYFVADGVLAAGAKAGGCEPAFEPSPTVTCNLYVTDTVTGETKLIAVLSELDALAWEAGTFHDELDRLSARVSASGNYLAFMSEQSLTGYDNRDALSGVPDEEVYEYDAASGRLACASCNPTGARPVGMLDHEEVEHNAEGEQEVFTSPLVDNQKLWQGHWLAGSILGYISAGSQVLYQPRYLDDNGRLFFNSPVGLVPQDANGKEDVYEFEPADIGSCTSSTSTGTQLYVSEETGSLVEGCIGLISSGTSSEESAFLDASGKGQGGEEGEDVFFMTGAKLSGADVDGAMDIYDAHTCSSGSPCPPAAGPVPPACTTAESCRAASPPQPAIYGAPSSETFSGAGNLSTALHSVVTKRAVKCAKGKKLSHGRCVKKGKKKKQGRAHKSKSRTAERASRNRRGK
jgi:DNA-binding beta-propeller fold protein YncE